MTTFSATARNARTADLIAEWGVTFDGTVLGMTLGEAMAKCRALREEAAYINAHMYEWIESWEAAESAYCAVGAGSHFVDFYRRDVRDLSEEADRIEEALSYETAWSR